MNSDKNCPPPEVLDRLLLGEADAGAQAALVRPLEWCADCRARLDRAAASGLIPSKSSLAAGNSDFGPAFYRALDGLAAPINPSQDSADQGPAQRADANWYTRLLEPATDPQYLGRLGPYDIASVRGQGGMGIVFRARDSVTNQLVAIKILA